jgi:hypothetical protein
VQFAIGVPNVREYGDPHVLLSLGREAELEREPYPSTGSGRREGAHSSEQRDFNVGTCAYDFDLSR